MKNNFSEIWDRIRSETDLQSFKDLGQIIGRTGPAVSGAKAKNDFPPGWAYLVAQKYGLLTEWIMTGEGPKRLSEISNNLKFPNQFQASEGKISCRRNLEILDEIEEWITEEVEKSPKKEIWFEVQMQESFSGFKEWKRKRDGQESGEYRSGKRQVA